MNVDVVCTQIIWKDLKVYHVPVYALLQFI